MDRRYHNEYMSRSSGNHHKRAPRRRTPITHALDAVGGQYDQQSSSCGVSPQRNVGRTDHGIPPQYNMRQTSDEGPPQRNVRQTDNGVPPQYSAGQSVGGLPPQYDAGQMNGQLLSKRDQETLAVIDRSVDRGVKMLGEIINRHGAASVLVLPNRKGVQVKVERMCYTCGVIIGTKIHNGKSRCMYSILTRRRRILTGCVVCRKMRCGQRICADCYDEKRSCHGLSKLKEL